MAWLAPVILVVRGARVVVRGVLQVLITTALRLRPGRCCREEISTCNLNSFGIVVFSQSSCPEDVKLVQTWPNYGTGNTEPDQVPTVLHHANARSCESVGGLTSFSDSVSSLISDYFYILA